MNLRVLLCFVVLLHVPLGASSFSGAGTFYPPVVMLIPDQFYFSDGIFFESGGPLERFTGRRDAWYAIYGVPIRPGSYTIILWYNGDPSRIKMFALDNFPLEQASMKYELRVNKIEKRHPHSFVNPVYAVTFTIPIDVRIPVVYILVEQLPPIGQRQPLSVFVKAYSEQSEFGGSRFKQQIPDSLSGHQAIELPVPRWPDRLKEN
jgi:hypothetical protein